MLFCDVMVGGDGSVGVLKFNICGLKKTNKKTVARILRFCEKGVENFLFCTAGWC